MLHVAPVVVSAREHQCFDAPVSDDVIAAQQAIIGEAGRGEIAGSVVTERPLLARSGRSWSGTRGILDARRDEKLCGIRESAMKRSHRAGGHTKERLTRSDRACTRLRPGSTAFSPWLAPCA